MRIGFLTSSYPDDVGHPRGIFVHRLARSLVEEGLEVTVVAPGSDQAPVMERRDGVQIRRLQYWLSGGQRLTRELAGIEPAVRRSPWLSLQLLLLFGRMVTGVRRLFRESDLVHAHWLYPAGTAALLGRLGRNRPLVVTCHGGDLNLARRSTPFELLARTVLRHSQCCLGVSPRDRETIRTWVNDTSRVEFLPVGVDLDRPPPELPTVASDAHATRFHGCRCCRVLYVGSLVTRKSVATLLDALYELRDGPNRFQCAVVGNGPEGPRLKRQAHDLNLSNVQFVGARGPDEVASWMKTADVLVLPSLSEPWGSVVAEAMAVGTPVIVSETAGSASLVEDAVSGFTFPERDASALARRLTGVAAMSDTERANMGRAARQSVVDHAVDTRSVARRHIALYRDTLRDQGVQGTE